MKLFIFLLALGNLLFLAYSGGYFGHPENPDAVRLDKQVLPERMRIVSRGEAPGVPAKVPEPVKVAPAAEEAKPEPVAAKPEASGPVCLLWEHLSVAEANQLGTLLGGKFAEFKVARRLLGEGNGWLVFVPPLPSKADAEKKAAELRQFGVTDYFIIQDGPNRHAISLGVFSSEKGGQERLAELKEKGVRSARLMQRPDKDGTVSLQATGPDATKAALLESVAKVLPKVEAQGCK